ncbi:MAG: tRNA uridine-5-carboxymethylaminomethyl(34) synthesis GTPase MnmE [Gammaproteobacteria bacterium]
MRSETIVAVSTPPGRGGIGVVRISGPTTREVIGRLCAPLPEPRRASLRSFTDADGVAIDEGLVLYFASPASYTGEDMAELHAHGNPVVLAALVDAACGAGARPARPGEFTERAYLNDRLDLAQAEAVADLIASHSVRAARAARRTLGGELGRTIAAIIDAVQLERARLEAGIDFADELAAAGELEQQVTAIAGIARALAALAARARTGARLAGGAAVALVGAPNVGKSSLLNRLADDDRAIVADLPGTTRDAISVDLTIDGIAVRLIDTAGLRPSADPIEQAGMQRARDALQHADVTLLVSDAPEAPSLAAVLDELGLAPADVNRPLLVRNKIDRSAVPAGIDRRGAVPVASVSAKTGAGLAELRAALVGLLGVEDGDENEFAARERHVVALAAALAALESIDADMLGSMPEIAAEHLRDATTALEAIGGRYDTEALLGDIFSRFCIGK